MTFLQALSCLCGSVIVVVVATKFILSYFSHSFFYIFVSLFPLPYLCFLSYYFSITVCLFLPLLSVSFPFSLSISFLFLCYLFVSISSPSLSSFTFFYLYFFYFSFFSSFYPTFISSFLSVFYSLGCFSLFIFLSFPLFSLFLFPPPFLNCHLCFPVSFLFVPVIVTQRQSQSKKTEKCLQIATDSFVILRILACLHFGSDLSTLLYLNPFRGQLGHSSLFSCQAFLSLLDTVAF
ncbi:unnamed protein product [Acanthosepion pharaonis]|uniref:Uncharacterized protein n=1 Tax=Acanthosepion pharaonis TaxID=158019 RepID=A0A812DPA9_ACAPH|nr:unnamed protein product [Sepia pharaonis]